MIIRDTPGGRKKKKKEKGVMNKEIDKIIAESINKFLIREYYGKPNGIDEFVDMILDEIGKRWVHGNFTPFNVSYQGLPFGYLVIRPTNNNLRAAYAMPPSSTNSACVLFLNPGRVFGDVDEGMTLHATLVHELTHMIEDIGRRRSNIEGLGGEIERVGHMKAFNNVIHNGVLRKDNENRYSSIERAVARVIFNGIGFERNARNAAMFTKLMDLPAGTIKTYEDGIRFLRSTDEYQRYERAVACAWRLVNITDENDKAEALFFVNKYSDYKFKNWNDFRKWLKQFIRRYENKMNNIIPKMINHVINRE